MSFFGFFIVILGYFDQSFENRLNDFKTIESI